MTARGAGRWRVVAAAGLGALAVAVAAGAPREAGEPYDPQSTRPAGARGLVLVLEALGGEVDVARGAPPDEAGTAVLLRDHLNDADVAATLDWVAAGGVLVAVDGGPVEGAVGPRPGPCPAALAGVDRVAVEPAAEPLPRGGELTPCFDGFVAHEAVGAGTVVVVASPAPFSNELLDEADNAVLAAALLVPRPGTAVAFVAGPSLSPATDEGLADLVAPRVRQSLLQGGIAVMAWAAWRARRLGRPVTEPQPVAVAGSELVEAVGRLMDARRRPEEAAAILRAGTRRAVAPRLGLDAGADAPTLAAAVAARSGTDADRVAAALDHLPVATDDDLVAVAADLDRIRSDILGSRRP